MKQISALHLTAEEESNVQLLEITDGILIGVTNSAYLTGSLILPDTITEIGKKALSGCTDLTSITIPDSVTQIGYGAFFRCMNLTGITVHSDNPAYCSQENILYTKDMKILLRAVATGCVVIPYGVTEISYGAFSRCRGLTSITIPDSVIKIAMGAFCYCSNVTHIIIPSSVTDIGMGPFGYCTKLTDISVDKANPVYCSKDNMLYTKDMKTLVQATPVKTFMVPEHVTAIGGYCLAGCTDVTTVIIPDRVTEIGEGAFDGCEKLDTIIIKSELLTEIGYDAFSHIKPDARVTVKNELIKALLQTCGSDIQNGQITVNPNL
ncbi:leucine-rich repeat domain-containing protein [Treponema medium]|uniref:Leucine-rich repeat domain-containing protein n=2 Tax=Treponema medium TaxID=58231 RepID=A0AA87NR36_TREMD|nr:leucine-rich repeat domain-containing protein [Treponema medium]EPF27910.1 hypothetical protein HMPREF9195_02040 [Treponema medium ATCC 700293]QSH98141.1 leucine-rich repeat domain-containing protein [Treponema medium]